MPRSPEIMRGDAHVWDEDKTAREEDGHDDDRG